MKSTFITLTDYCILEYMMTPLGYFAPEIINSNFFFVKNANLNMYQIYNTETALTQTHNTRGSSVVAIGGSKLVHVDLSVIPIYTQYDPNIVETLVDNSYTNTLVMDTMRFHFASGYNFTEVENIVLGARQKLNNLQQVQLANVLINSVTAQDLLVFNNRPLYLANGVFDKYVDVKIPSCAYMDQNFNQFGVNSFEYLFTEGSGLITNAPLTVSLIEANREDLYANNNQTYETYRVVNYFEGSVPQTNEFDSLGAVIQEATDGDYIQFFATWNGGFPADLISTLNAKGTDQNWILVHQLQVYEQIGTAQVPSGNFLVYQEDTFDVPLSYRPILKDAAFAVSMSIDYTLRLLNKLTGDQVVREGSLTVFNPNKYGKHLSSIPLAAPPQSMKVYNKIQYNGVDSSQLFLGHNPGKQVISDSQVTTVTKTVQVSVPVFYKQANIRISHKNALLTSSDSSTEVIYGQGELVLPIDPSDNFIKFTVYEADAKDQTKQNFANLNNNSKFNLNFGTDTTFVYPSLTDQSVENPSKGQIAFRIPKDQAKKILQSTDNLVFITLIAEDGSETLMYTGQWQSSANYANILNAADKAKSQLQNDPQVIIAGLNETITQLQNELQKSNNKVVSQKAGLSSAVASTNISETYQNINALATKVPNSMVSTLSNPVTTVQAASPAVNVSKQVSRRTQGNTAVQSPV